MGTQDMLRTKSASRVIVPSRLPAATLVLIVGNIVWMLVFGLDSYEFEGVTATELGFSCGLLACAIAVWAVLGSARKITALLVWTLVSIAVVLTEPLVASILMWLTRRHGVLLNLETDESLPWFSEMSQRHDRGSSERQGIRP
ncbi:hypothetical protein ASG54_05435 [Aureimonas sp. Leaf460]|nr:hypothetical protein ASG62_25170 [Aureimonas sp. Leaf427]KQT65824.1 hypothetical protein ASG54_05435 [Aureimonas sp. Leaf460]